MKKIIISIAAIASSLLIINFSALYVHKKSLSDSLDAIQDRLEKFDLTIKRSDISISQYLAWKPSFHIDEISIKKGDRKRKLLFSIKNINILIQPFDKNIKIAFDDDQEIIINDIYRGKSSLYINHNEPLTLNIDLKRSVDLFLRDYDKNFLSKVSKLELITSGFNLVERSNINDTKEANKILQAANSSLKISNHLSKDDEIYNFIISLSGWHYNKDSQDPEVQFISQVGKMNTEINFTFEKTKVNDQAVEKFKCNRCISMTEKFGISLDGEMFLKAGSAKNIDIDIDSSIHLFQYKNWLDFYHQSLNNEISKYALSTNNQQLQIFSNNQFEKLLNLFESLPDVKIDDGNMSLNIVQKSDSELYIGGRSVNNIKKDLIKILIPNIKHW